MNNDPLQHVNLNGMSEYASALDSICGLASTTLFIFDKNFSDLGFNSPARFERLANFLRANPNHRLQLLAHDTRPLSQNCPRLINLLRQFGHNMFIYQTPLHLHHITEPFAVADDRHFVRRFHFDDPRGILATNDGEGGRLLKSRFIEMWTSSQPSPSTATFTL